MMAETYNTERIAMPTCTWDHIHLRSADPEGTAQWFERMLGAQVIRSMQQGKPRIDLKLGGANIFIAPVTPGDGVNPPPVTPYQGLDHFGLAVSGIDAIAAELKKQGRRVHQGAACAAPRHQDLLPARAAGHLDRTARPRSEICLRRAPVSHARRQFVRGACVRRCFAILLGTSGRAPVALAGGTRLNEAGDGSAAGGVYAGAGIGDRRWRDRRGGAGRGRR